MTLNIVLFCLLLLGLAGAVCVATGRIGLTLAGHVCWLVANVGWAVYNWSIGQKIQAFLFLIYWVITLYGVMRWTNALRNL